MAYFKLDLPDSINTYAFDYHSHFTGILPVRSKARDDTRPSMARLVAEAYNIDPDRAELVLFDYALALMIDPASNPFARLGKAANKAAYERAECAGENIYIACVIVLDRFGYLGPELRSLPIERRDIYDAVRSTVIIPALTARGDVDRGLLKTIRYFNGKTYSTNKYTPFDDCYKMRGVFVKQFCGADPADYSKWDQSGPQAQRYHAWIDATFDYLYQSGVRNTQSAATEDEIEALNARVTRYNSARGSNFKLLVHTPNQYLRDGKLREYLDAKVLPQLINPAYTNVVGLDLLGAENKVGNYRELFAFLAAQSDQLVGQFGPGKPRSRTLIAHIHCGEGSGFGADNRSMTGYGIYELGSVGDGYFKRFSRYILSCAKAAEERLADTPRGTRGTAIAQGLFDELFHNNAMTYRSRALRRFDISTERSRSLAAYNAKRNVMALSESFDSVPVSGARSWYQQLTQDSALFSFRLGHDYYYRSYMAAKYPAVAFDTNLGSNAITGASGLFASIESYRINRGFRHLDGYIDTDVLEAAGNAVAYMGSDALTQEQIAKFASYSAIPGRFYDVLDEADTQQWIWTQLTGALGALSTDKALSYQIYKNLVNDIAGNAGPGAQRYQALIRVFTLYQNWRSYLLGADGQGAEHTETQDEFLRMLILLAYTLLPTGVTDIDESLLGSLGNFVDEIAHAYWRDTVGVPTVPEPPTQPLRIERIDGFKSPASVVALYRRAVAQ
ncbi:MAG: hypothetical protein ACREO8_09395 [Luteimonas sp.]